LKKCAAKNFQNFWASVFQTPGSKGVNAFCFFFSKKKRFRILRYRR
jgi:hypothetical protein